MLEKLFLPYQNLKRSWGFVFAHWPVQDSLAETWTSVFEQYFHLVLSLPRLPVSFRGVVREVDLGFWDAIH